MNRKMSASLIAMMMVLVALYASVGMSVGAVGR